MSWEIVNNKLSKDYKFANYKASWDFVNSVSELAEEQNHHPDIEFGWGYVKISLYSHDAKAVTERDYKLAETIDQL